MYCKKTFWFWFLVGLIVCLLSFVLENTAPAADISVSYGKSTSIDFVKHPNVGESYSIKTLITQLKDDFPLLFSISKHTYNIKGLKSFSTSSIGLQYVHTITRGIFFTSFGIGGKFTETDKRNKWLANSHILADLSGSVGIRWKNLELAYVLRHLSAPWRDDQGLNYDIITFGFNFTF